MLVGEDDAKMRQDSAIAGIHRGIHRHSQMHTHMHSHMQSHMHSQMHSHKMQTLIEGVFWLVGALELVFVGGVVVVVAFLGSAFLGSAFLGSHSNHLLAWLLFSVTLIVHHLFGYQRWVR
jgi:hypothetical protein